MNWRRVLRDVAIAVVIFVAVGAWQTRHLVKRGDEAPPIAGNVLGTPSSFDLQAQRGKTLLVYFFAPWCGVCKVSAGNLDWARQWLGSNVEIAAVALDYETEGDVARFARETDMGTVPVVLGSDAIRDAYKINAYPSYYVIDDQGRVTSASVGYSTLLGMLIRVWLS